MNGPGKNHGEKIFPKIYYEGESFSHLSEREIADELDRLSALAEKLGNKKVKVSEKREAIDEIFTNIDILRQALKYQKPKAIQMPFTVRALLGNLLSHDYTERQTRVFIMEEIEPILSFSDGALYPVAIRALNNSGREKDKEFIVKAIQNHLKTEVRNGEQDINASDLLRAALWSGPKRTHEGNKEIIALFRDNGRVPSLERTVKMLPFAGEEDPAFTVLLDTLGERYGIRAATILEALYKNSDLTHLQRSEIIKKAVECLLDLPHYAKLMGISDIELWNRWHASAFNAYDENLWEGIKKNMDSFDFVGKEDSMLLAASFGVWNLGRYPDQVLKNQVAEEKERRKAKGIREEAKKEEQKIHPYGIIFMPHYDHSGSFYSYRAAVEVIHGSLKRGSMPLRVMEYDDKIDIRKHSHELEKRYGKAAKFVFLGAHGSRLKEGSQFMELGAGGREQKRSILDLKELIEDTRNNRIAHLEEFMDPDCVIVLISCAQGIDDGLAQELSKRLHRTVVASPAVGSLRQFIYDDSNPDLPFIVTYYDTDNERLISAAIYRDGVKITSSINYDEE